MNDRLRWTTATPPTPSRLAVIAPHPDDEVLGAAGLMRWAADAGADVVIVSVTDGEASHASSDRITPDALAQRRALERAAALAVLGLEAAPVWRLGLTDGAVRDQADRLAALLMRLLRIGDTLVVPWRHDGHPDHEAVTEAAERAAETIGMACWEVPIWSRVHGTFDDADVRELELGEFSNVKRAAVCEFRSQLIPLGPGPGDGPVVHPRELRALTSSTELITVSQP